MATSRMPTYERIRQELLAAILRGEYELHQPFITQIELSDRYHVSRSTAERAIDELVRAGYLIRYRRRGTFVAPVILPPSPTADATLAIACIMSMTRSDHKTATIRGIDKLCREHDMHLLFFDSGESSATEAANVRRAMRAGVVGIIVYPVDGNANLPLFREVAQTNLPLVMIDRYYPTVPCHRVVPDNVAAGYLLTQALIAQGHRHIGTVWQEVDCTSVQERFIGYRQALFETHAPIESDLASMHRYLEMTAEQRLALLQRWLRAPYRPSAIIAANSNTLGVLATDLLKLKVRIGQDIILASMDTDDPGVPIALGALSVNLPSFEMGTEAMRLLLESINEEQQSNQHIMLPVKLTVPEMVVVNSQVAS